jgi:hypothetical protein
MTMVLPLTTSRASTIEAFSLRLFRVNTVPEF